MPRETKAQREKRLAAEAAEQEAAELEAQSNTEAEPTPDTQPDAVVLFVKRLEDGGAEVNPQPLGDVRLTEITDIIRLGLKTWEQRAGLARE